jgi:hypothetical protein
VSAITIVSDAPNCVITLADSGGITYDGSVFTVHGTELNRD